jgi:hypothetical protein
MKLGMESPINGFVGYADKRDVASLREDLTTIKDVQKHHGRLLQSIVDEVIAEKSARRDAAKNRWRWLFALAAVASAFVSVAIVFGGCNR